MLRISHTLGWFQIQHVEEDLELLIFYFYFPSAEIINVSQHTGLYGAGNPTWSSVYTRSTRQALYN